MSPKTHVLKGAVTSPWHYQEVVVPLGGRTLREEMTVTGGLEGNPRGGGQICPTMLLARAQRTGLSSHQLKLWSMS